MRRSKLTSAVFPRGLREEAATADCSEVRVSKSDVTIRRDAMALLVLGGALLLVAFPTVSCRHVSVPPTTVRTQGPSALAKAPVPHTLEEALATLAAHGSPDLLTLVQEKAEDAAIAELHLGFGTWLRNDWGLWEKGPLYDDLARRGLVDPEDMSSVVLRSFWRQQRGHPIDLEGQLTQYERWYQSQRKWAARETDRQRRMVAAVRAMTAETHIVRGNTPRLRLGKRATSGLIVTWLAVYGAGTLLGVEVWDSDSDRARIEPFLLPARKTKLRRVRLPELERIHSCAVADGTFWAVGLKGTQPVLVQVGGARRTPWRLPRAAEMPRLGTYGGALLLIYDDAMYQLTTVGWSVVLTQGQVPRGITATSSHGQHVYFLQQDAVDGEGRLSWFEMAGPGRWGGVSDELSRQMGELTPSPWKTAWSYAVAPTGHLWIVAGHSFGDQSLLERDARGLYRAHVVSPLIDAASHAPTLSALSFDDTGVLVAAGPHGVYRLHLGTLTPVVSFENIEQLVTDGDDLLHWEWQPQHFVAIGEGRYVIAGAQGGVYVVTLLPDNRASLRAVDDRLGAPLTM